jgi:hypothetical protein
MVLEYEPEAPRVRRIVITCDQCNAETDSLRIAKAGGTLTELGWFRRFNEITRSNEYFCPKCKRSHA